MSDLVSPSAALVEQELRATDSWIRSHVSEYSAFHYRQVLILRLQSMGTSITAHLSSELELLNHLIQTFTDRESLFLHRRFALKLLSKEGIDCRATEKQFIQEQESTVGHEDWRRFVVQRHRKWFERYFETFE